MIHRAGFADETLSEIRVDAPVSNSVGISQSVARHPVVDSHVLESFGLSVKADFDIAQAFPVGELGESHAAVLFCAEKRFYLVVAFITFYASTERVPWKVAHYLRENQFPRIHDVCLLLD